MGTSEAGKKEVKRILDEYGETPIKDISPETIAQGKATITVTSEDGGISKSYTVNVVNGK